MTLQTLMIMLAATVLAVPLCKRLGLGAVLGYLAGGVLIGPWGLGLIRDAEAILHIGEFGVVMLLFLIGLELQPSRLWALRRPVFVLGGAQVLATGLALAGTAAWLGLAPGGAILVGFGLSLSSTAFVLQLLAEKGQLTTQHGRESFAILLFQDLAVIPLLALVPLLAPGGVDAPDGAGLRALIAAAVVGAVVLASRYLTPRLFQLIAAARSHEASTAATLLLVFATAFAIEAVGLSMSLGAFLAGVLFSDSEFRHELEANIEPFKGLLLGFFFIAVGMSANLGLLAGEPETVLGLTLALMAFKAAIVTGVARFAYGSAPRTARHVGVLLAQGGEFAFVLFGLGLEQGVIDAATRDLLVMAVTASMALTPLALVLFEAHAARLSRHADAHAPAPAPDDGHAAPPVVIAGYGRFGRNVARVLALKQIPFTVLERELDNIELGKRLGRRVYFGDVSRFDILRAAQLGQAKLLVLAIDNEEVSLSVAAMVRRHFPQVAVLSRSRNLRHSLRLLGQGVQTVNSDTYLASLQMAESVLTALGTGADEAGGVIDQIRQLDARMIARMQAVQHDEQALIALLRGADDEMATWLTQHGAHPSE